MATYLADGLSKKIEVIENGRRRKVTAREAIALKVISQALKGDPKAVSLLFGKDSEINAAVRRANIPRTKEMTLEEAKKVYEETIRDTEIDW